MSEKSSSTAIKKQEKKIVENLIKRTHFSGQEIERLLKLYRSTVVCNILDKKNVILINCCFKVWPRMNVGFCYTLVRLYIFGSTFILLFRVPPLLKKENIKRHWIYLLGPPLPPLNMDIKNKDQIFFLNHNF